MSGEKDEVKQEAKQREDKVAEKEETYMDEEVGEREKRRRKKKRRRVVEGGILLYKSVVTVSTSPATPAGENTLTDSLCKRVWCF